MVEVNLEKHWSNVPKGWRHFVDSMPSQKITRITKRVKEKLINKVMLITPNIPEAEILTKTKIKTKEDMIFAAYKLLEIGAKNVLIKGGHLNSKFVKDI